MNDASGWHWFIPLAAVLASTSVTADVVTDWNTRACAIVVDAQAPAPAAVRAIAIVQTAVHEAVNAITNRYPGVTAGLDAASGASVDAAVAAANRATLASLVPSRQDAIDDAYAAAVSAIAEEARESGIAVGERAAAAVLAARADDGVDADESYRPRTAPGIYVPTAVPVASQWSQRRPWVMPSADAFRPGPQPDLASDVWARDYDEVKALGAKDSTRRSAAQTDIARFWAATGPAIYFPIVRSLADTPGHDVARNARLLAAAAQAMDDALIAVFDAKYTYEFWRPLTAIRNGDRDGNDATERDAGWVPFIDTPMHPEYPCAHCSVAAAMGEVLRADIGDAPAPALSGTSATAPGMTRRWTSVDELVQEVAMARIYDGVHYRTSGEVGSALGAKVGALVASRLLRD